MSEDNFVSRARRNTGNRTEIRDALTNNKGQIIQAQKAGCSLGAIYRTLIADGVHAGAGLSSFRQALRWLEANHPGWHDGAPTAAQSPTPPPASPPAPARVTAAEPPVQDRSRFVDSRFPINFGGA